MRVLVDTSVWSLALRRARTGRAEEAIVQELAELLRDVRVLIIGPIRQEILSGISDENAYEELRQRLSAFPDMELSTPDYELAAKLSNDCRRHGVQGSHTDFLICAAAIRAEAPIFTMDKDFIQYKKHVPIELHQAKGAPSCP